MCLRCSNLRKDRHYEEPYFLPQRSRALKDESAQWHDQHLSGKLKISFDYQIPADLEVFAIMLIHAAVNPSVKNTFNNLKRDPKRNGSFKSSADTINASLVIDSPALDAYRLLVNNDRRTTIGLPPSQNRQLLDHSDERDTPDAYNIKCRRWITTLRLFCAVEGYLPHLSNGKWRDYVTHFKLKVSFTCLNFYIVTKKHITYLVGSIAPYIRRW